MVENTQGIVELISTQNKACKIDGTWYSFGPLIKPQYVKKGPCEYRIEQTEEGLNDLVVFVRATGASQPQGTTPHPAGPVAQNAVAQSEMNRMSALKFAGNIYQATAQEENAKRLAEEAHAYLQKGIWVSTQQVE